MPTRICRSCRQRKPAHELVRLVVRDGSLTVGGVGGVRDSDGRGQYTCPTLRCARRAARGGRRSEGRDDPRLAEKLLVEARRKASAWLDHRQAGLRRRNLGTSDARTTALRGVLERLEAACADAADGAQGTRETRP